MAETLSPNTKQKGPFSPTKFVLGSNDDKLERARARAARAAVIRRKPLPVPPPSSTCLDEQQILELFQNCIKLASENKINQKNTWELGLIDHLCEIVKVEQENDSETNFQKASCTLEAGVKIYSMRVDSVHSEAYKVLGGINRVGKGNDQDPVVEDANAENEQEEGHPREEQEKKLSPLSTLESSFDSINVKKFDAAFAVDPLYHQTSAQFDEGGAKGLLLNNLGIYGTCSVLFDSCEIPGKSIPEEIRNDRTDSIDICFAKDCVEEMVLNMPKKDEISPSLRHMISQFSGEMQVPAETDLSSQLSPEQTSESFGLDVDDDDAFDNCGAWPMDHDDGIDVAEQGSHDVDQISSRQQEGSEPFAFPDAEDDDRSERVDDYLFLSLGFSSKHNSWAGPDHWKYRKVKVSEEPCKEDGSPVKTKKTKSRKAEPEISFTKALDTDLSHVFAPPKNPKLLLLPANRISCNRLLPEDCHYQPENLVKLFLRPNVTCLGRRGKKVPDEAGQQSEDFGAMPSWDDDGGFPGTFDDAFDDGNAFSDTEESSTLVSQPRQVNKIEVQYDKTSKQVDVQVLKETLWDQLNQTSIKEESVSFKHILAAFPTECRASASIEAISPHLCFICLLHLANEHGLRIQGCVNLDDLSIQLEAHNNSLPNAVA
ncbi:PREDICTED: condensin complex subunit 2 [Nicotiana attenuata]|uniref:Condensin complex subunit 2 n=1 Tax=Nicotiana attenuata TaxID=49451 RepID=A0A1J6ISE2_NICAT|nr:PREDICTED: condensin complex subunit 2 [Nicotiana attenuata]OIT03480.1 condensin complex subunit 2 [Nicotiana attenuata]